MFRVDETSPFEYVRPDEDGVRRIEAVRQGCDQLWQTLIDNVPPSAERTTAIRSLQLVSMWANAGVVLDQKSRRGNQELGLPEGSSVR